MNERSDAPQLPWNWLLLLHLAPGALATLGTVSLIALIASRLA